MDIEAVKTEIADFHRGKKWILTPDVAVAATPLVEQLREWGVADPMIVSGMEGVGDPPDIEHIHYTRTSGNTIMLGVRAFLRSIENPSAELLADVERFDPDHEALVMGQMFSRESMLAGRRVYGARPREWRALEDKTVIDAIWESSGVEHAPAEVVSVNDALAASKRVHSQLGSVWAGDNKEGWNGGGEYVRWVRDTTDEQAALDWFSEHADQVRVMPFLDGLPCSIHGFATGNGVAVFNPVELLIFRHLDQPAFFYAGGSNFWNPSEGLRDQMRSAARSVGKYLFESLGYLGGFGIDGIATVDGFRPTELNPRLSLGHNLHSRSIDFPLGSVERMLIEGDIAIDAERLESTLLSGSSERRGGAMFRLDEDTPQRKTGFVVTADGVSAVDPEEPNDGTMQTGPAAFGSILIIRFESDRTPVGPSVAPRTLQVLDFAREFWGVSVPSLEAAPDVSN